MAPRDFDDDVENADEKYHESSDEDFDPESAPPEEASSSEDEDHQTAAPIPRKGKRKAPHDDELDSGDEVTIQAARKKRSKKKKKGKTGDDELILSEDEGGDGGLVKTRAQRRGEQRERRPLARIEGATADIDALWAQMMAAPLKPLSPAQFQEQDAPMDGVAVTRPAATSVPIEEEEVIAVKKVYTFAGQDTTEEKQILRSQLDKYLSEGWKTLDAATLATPSLDQSKDVNRSSEPRIRRPLCRPSRFDPNPTGYVRALAPEHQLSWPRKQIDTLSIEQENATPIPSDAPKPKVEKAQKLNVVDKSRMDWTGFVDKEGIAEELDTHGKTKEAYLGRMEFLAGVEARREEERLSLKQKAAAAAPAP